MVQYATKDELELLKEQMQVLKDQLAQSDVINQKMLEVTFRHKVENNTSTRQANVAAMAAGLVIISSMLYGGFVKQELSTWFTLLSVAWGLLTIGVGYYRYRLNMREMLLNTPLTESVTAILQWKKQEQTCGWIISIGFLLWLPALLFEIWGDISQNIDHAVISLGIVAVAVVLTVQGYRTVNKTISELLEQIQELKK